MVTLNAPGLPYAEAAFIASTYQHVTVTQHQGEGRVVWIVGGKGMPPTVLIVFRRGHRHKSSGVSTYRQNMVASPYQRVATSGLVQVGKPF